MGLKSGSELTLAGGRSLSENLQVLKDEFPITGNGYFGKRGKGRSRTRNIESSNPTRTAWHFAHIAAYSPVTTGTIVGKGLIWTMRDRSVVSYRFTSSSSDHSPVVELKVHGIPGVRSQKIHFVKKGK